MLGMAAMVLLLAVSCKKENKEEASGETKAMTFTAGISQGNGKTYLEGQKLLWSEGDVININNHDFTLTEGKGTNKGVFTGEATEADFYYAVYPSSGTLDGNTATITLPAEQPYVAGSFYKDIAPMVAMTDDSKSLTFTNVCGLLRLDVNKIGKTVKRRFAFMRVGQTPRVNRRRTVLPGRSVSERAGLKPSGSAIVTACARVP